MGAGIVNDHTPTVEEAKGSRPLDRGEVFRDGDWYGAGWGFKFVVGTEQTAAKPGDPVDGPYFSYNPRRPL
jgi:hypothetical protein